VILSILIVEEAKVVVEKSSLSPLEMNAKLLGGFDGRLDMLSPEFLDEFVSVW
jgi:hypothetical protein